MEVQHRTFLAAFQFLVLVGVHKKSERNTTHASRGFDDVRQQMLICRLIKICLLQYGVLVWKKGAVLKDSFSGFRMTGQIVILAIGNSFHFIELLCLFLAFGEETIKKIGRRL